MQLKSLFASGGYLLIKHLKTKSSYVQLKKALDGTLQAVLLFGEILSDTLICWGLIINPYNHCASTMVEPGETRVKMMKVKRRSLLQNSTKRNTMGEMQQNAPNKM